MGGGVGVGGGGADEKRGIAKFIELLRKHGLGPVYEPKFVS